LLAKSPKIKLLTLSESRKIALLDLHVYASVFEISEKREVEKKAALFVVREVLDDQNLEILYQENGKPYLSNKIKISISHSHDLLAVLFSSDNGEVGVDIEKVRDKVLKIKHKFLSESELQELENASPELYTLYWGAKEAIYKSAGVSGLLFAEQISIEPFSFLKTGGKMMAQVNHSECKKSYTLRYEIFEDYVLVYTNR